MKTSPLIVLSVLACLAFSSKAFSTPITIQNYSFETPVEPDNTGTSGGTTGWTPVNYAGTNTNYGVYNFTNSQFTNATDTSVTLGSLTPIGGDQRQIIYVNSQGVGGTLSMIQVLTGVTLQASSTYTLKVAIGNQGAIPDTYQVSLYVGGTVVGGTYSGGTLLGFASGDSGTVTVHNFADAIATYNSPSSGLASGNLAIVITNTHTSFSTIGQDVFDNVRLDVVSTPVPEPSSVALICIGGVAFMAWRTRRKMA